MNRWSDFDELSRAWSVVGGRGPGAVVALVVLAAWMVGGRVETTKYAKHTKGSRWVGEF